MEIEAKVENPLNLKLSKDSQMIMEDLTNNLKHPLVPGAVIGGIHYGFFIIRDTKDGQKEDFYPTQCRITAVGIVGEYLRVYEEGKYNSWIFTLDGNLIEHATFNKLLDSDRTYFAENFGFYSEEAMEEANVYKKR